MTEKLTQQLNQINTWLSGPNGKELWDVITAARGPDSPSELGGDYSSPSYSQRVERKMRTVAIIRGKAFPQARGARIAEGDAVVLPADRKTWDHFDKHVERAARQLGLRVVDSASRIG